MNWIVLIGGIAGILYPAFVDEHLSLTQILVSLLDWKKQWEAPTLGFFMRWLCVFLVFGSAYILTTRRLYRNLPISIAWTHIELRFDNAEGRRVTVRREQALRANQPNVTAYFMSAKPTSPNGRLLEEMPSLAYCDGCTFPNSVEKDGDERRGFEMIHKFHSALPYAWYIPLLPMWVWNRDPSRLVRFLRDKITIRHMTTTYVDEYSVPRPSFNLTSIAYPQHNLRVTVRSPQSLPNLRAMRIKNNAVVDVHFQPQSDGSVSLFIDKLQLERLRVTWTGPQ